MKRFLFTVCAFIALPFGSAVGCNAILGNQPGLLGGDGGFFDAPEESDTGPCGAGNKLCASTCLSTLDPANGCSGECSACPSPTNGQAACNGPSGSCGLGSCNTGFADCDNNASDGCESLLTSKTSCGSCANNCQALGEAFCSPDNSGGVECSNTCNGTDCCGDQPCSDQTNPTGACVDLTSNLANCGACGRACSPVANATISCSGGQCGHSCNSGYQACPDGTCAVYSPSSCGCGKQDCTQLGAGSACDSVTGTCVCNTGGNCQFVACCGGNVCCGGAGSMCVAEDNNACGSSCDKCINPAQCMGGFCQCSVGTTCHGTGGTSCCAPGDYCDAGTCMTSTGTCPSASSCPLSGSDSGAASGCCRSGSTCLTPNNSFIGCGSTCANCGISMADCCCPDAGSDPTGWSCSPKLPPDAGGGCRPGCNP